MYKWIFQIVSVLTSLKGAQDDQSLTHEQYGILCQ